MSAFDIKPILEAYPKPVPRYTSYPTAPQFREAMGFQLKEQLIAQLHTQERVSLYLHIPFCDRLCWFCGCHTKHTAKYAPIADYVQHLIEEIEQFGDHTLFNPMAGHIHFGGGSPSLLRKEDMAALRFALDSVFHIDHKTEISVELDPSDNNDGLMDALTALGVTRASIGVQDFHPAVQQAINRPQSYEVTRDLVDALHAHGIKQINIDALYGLPFQTSKRLEATIEQCISLHPNRIALFGYAHVPWAKKHQNMIQEDSLPNSEQRFHDATAAASQLEAAGYDAIGIDHFALPSDSLSRAAKAGKLCRNFQGYTTDNCNTLIGFGCSSIGQFDGGYIQNIVPTGQYQQAVKAGQSTAAKAFQLTTEDKMRATLIERLMCDLRINFRSLEAQFGDRIYPLEALARQLSATDQFHMVEMDNRVLKMSEGARLATRIIASHFDSYYAASEFRFSKAV